MFQLSATPPAPRHCCAHESAVAALEAALELREMGHGQVRIMDAATGKKYRVAEFTSSYWRRAK